MSRTFMNVIRETKRTSIAHTIVGILLSLLSHFVVLSLRFTQFLLNNMVGRSRGAVDSGDAFSWMSFTPFGLIIKINTWLAVISLKIISFLLAHFPGHPPTGRADVARSEPLSALTKLSPDDAEELFFVEKGVQIFYLQPDGTTHSPPQSTSLRVLQFHVPEDQQTDSAVSAVLQVGDWNYPLFPGASPSLAADYGAYIFPNLGDDNQDSCVGIIFDKTVPQEARDTFDRIIKRLTRSQDAAVSHLPSVQQAAAQSEERQEHTRVISQQLIRGGEFISDKIAELSDYTGQILRARSERLQESIAPQERTTFRVHWVLLKSLETANWVAGKARNRSARVVDMVGRLTVALAKRLAASLRSTASTFIPRTEEPADNDATAPRRPSSTIEKLTHVASAGIYSASNVYVSLENAAINLAKSLANESVSVIDVKYGEDAAQAARLGAQFLGNSVMTGYNLSNIAIGPKGVARRVIRDAGRSFVHGVAGDRRAEAARNREAEHRDGGGSPTRRRRGGGNSNDSATAPLIDNEDADLYDAQAGDHNNNFRSGETRKEL